MSPLNLVTFNQWNKKCVFITAENFLQGYGLLVFLLYEKAE
jgi:hypothetical protein